GLAEVALEADAALQDARHRDLALGVAVLGRLLEPLGGELLVATDAAAGVVGGADREFTQTRAVMRALAEPLQRGLLVVLAERHHAERHFGRGNVLLGGALVPADRLGVAPGDARALGVALAEIVGGIAVALFGCAAEPLHRLAVALLHALAQAIEHAEKVLARRVALLGLGLAGGERRGVV